MTNIDQKRYWGYPIVDFKNPTGLVADLKAEADLGLIDIERVYDDLITTRFTMDGFDPARFSAKLEYQVKAPETSNESSSAFEGAFIVKSLDGGIIRFLAMPDQVHFPNE